MHIAISHQALPPIHSPHTYKHGTFTPLLLQHRAPNTLLTPSSHSPAQARNSAVATRTYREHTKNTPRKHHLHHLPSTNPTSWSKSNREGNAGKEHARLHPSPPHPSSSPTPTKLQSQPWVRHATMRNIKHPTTAGRCYYTHTHTSLLSGLFAPLLSTSENLLHTFSTEIRSQIHLPSIWCFLTCVSNPFSTELLFLGGSPSPAFSCPLGDLRGIWLEYNGFVTSTLLPNFR